MKENGLLLVNLGSSDTPTTPDAERYLKEFLSDRNVVEVPSALWQPLLRGIILPTRSWRSAAFYHNCWTRDGSPLIVYTERLVTRIRKLMPKWIVRMAMAYSEPKTSGTAVEMKKECQGITVLPFFPSFTGSTAQTIIEKVRDANPGVRIVDRFSAEEGYLDLLARQVQTAWDKGKRDKLLISYHGILTAMVNHGDPYHNETGVATAGPVKRLSIPERQIKTACQSKFSPMPWLRPYLRNTLPNKAQLGHRDASVVAPSLVANCLGTLEEDQIQNYQVFRENGGNDLVMVPSFNDSPGFAQFIADPMQRKG